MAKIKVNPDMCACCGLCAASRPDLFKMGDDGHPEVIADCDGDLGFDCPAGAIEVE